LSTNAIANIDLVTRISEILEEKTDNKSEIQYTEDRPGHDVRYSLDPTKIRSQLGWRPEVKFDEGLIRTVGWYLENRLWWEPLATQSIMSPQPWNIHGGNMNKNEN
jgi:dTDP-glucose 4,6-dehydratase